MAATATTYGPGTTVPAPGAYTVTPPSRGALVHYHHVGDYVNATDYPDYRIRSTSCGRGRTIRDTWAVTAVDTATAPTLVTCPTCRQWAEYYATEAATAARRRRVIEQTHAWGDCTKHTAPDGYRHCHCHIETAAVRAGQPRTCRHCTEPVAPVAAGIPCPKCGGATIAPTPGRPEEFGDYCETCGIAWDPARVAAERDRIAAEPERCEHGRPMTEPCAPCAVAGHEPVDVDEDEHTDAACPSPTCTSFHTDETAQAWADRAYGPDEPEELQDAHRHLADCRACALLLPDGHEYASLIDAPLTAEELATLAARPDVDDIVRQVAADALAELDD